MSNFFNRKSFFARAIHRMLRADGGIKMRKVTTQLAALALLFASGSAFAWQCDFLTGGGFIFFNGNKANFGVGVGGKHGLPTWGHLEYIDHGLGGNIHGTSSTGDLEDGTSSAPKGTPVVARLIVGTSGTYHD